MRQRPDDLRATFVGTGAAFSQRWGHTNLLVEWREVALMVDFGSRAPVALAALGRSLAEITHVAVSHLHADHVGGLEELGFHHRFVSGRRPRLLLPRPLVGPLWEHTLRGGMEWIAGPAGEARRSTLGDYFDVVPLAEGLQEVDGLEVYVFRTDHVPGKDSFGFALRRPGQGASLVVVGDTRARVELLAAADRPEILAAGPVVHDFDQVDRGPSRAHVFLGKLDAYPEALRRRIVLAHYPDSCDEATRAELEALGWRVARPGMVLRPQDPPRAAPGDAPGDAPGAAP